MNNLTPILTLSQSAEVVIVWTKNQLQAHGFHVESTFDLHAARLAQANCPCPNHGTSDCSCQMVVLLVHGYEAQLGTIVVHGNDSETCISLLDKSNQSIEEKIIQALLPIKEESEI
jgi:hypothetical protein